MVGAGKLKGKCRVWNQSEALALWSRVPIRRWKGYSR